LQFGDKQTNRWTRPFDLETDVHASRIQGGKPSFQIWAC